MWNLKKNWYRQSYLQGRNRDTDVENKSMDTNRGGMNWNGAGRAGREGQAGKEGLGR